MITPKTLKNIRFFNVFGVWEVIPLSSVIKSLSSRYQALSSDLITLDNADNDLLDFPKAHLSGASWLTLGFLRAPETDSDWLTDSQAP